MQRLKDWLVYVLVRVFICLVQTLRLETCHAISRGLAKIACDLVRLRGKVVDENLRNVFPEMTAGQRRRVARQMWEHLFLLVCEVAHTPRKIHETNWRKHIHLHRARELVGCMLDVRPCVLISGHFGNFEVTSYAAGLLGFPIFTIARTLDNPYLDRFIRRFREANGQFILPKDGSAGQIDAALNNGDIIALLGDQSAGRKGCWVDFLGRPASCHKAIALFTLVSGAPLVVTYGRRVGRPLQFEIGFAGVADPVLGGEHLAGVKPLVQWYNDRLAEVVLQSPEQYWWVHRRWKDQPPQRKKTAAGGVDRAAGRSAA